MQNWTIVELLRIGRTSKREVLFPAGTVIQKAVDVNGFAGTLYHWKCLGSNRKGPVDALT